MRLIAAATLLLAACATTTPYQPIPTEWMSVPQAPRIRWVTIDAEGKVGTSSIAKERSNGPIRVEGNRLYNGEKALTEAFAAVDSFDFSRSRGEVAFSAKVDGGFDIGLVSSDGSAVHWVPSDPADEVAVQWAPRGNKISYVVRVTGGDVVRTFHVPSSFALAVPFPMATVHALAWDPQAERYAAAYSTVRESDAVDVTRYGGEERKTVVPAAQKLSLEVEPLGPGALLLRPPDLGYDERLPVVIWVSGELGWSDARAALLRSARVACVVTTAVPGEELLRTVRQRRWIDAGRVFVVSGAPPRAAPEAGWVWIAGDPSVPAGRFRRDGSVVAVAPAVVQSFAAGFVASEVARASVQPQQVPR